MSLQPVNDLTRFSLAGQMQVDIAIAVTPAVRSETIHTKIMSGSQTR